MTNGTTNQSAGERGPSIERRTVPRYTFIAAAEIVEPVSDTHISGRVSEISGKGCFIDVLNTLPKGTPIRVSITTDNASFSCAAHIIYAQDRMGVGVAFDGPSDDQQKVLDAWLTDLGH